MDVYAVDPDALDALVARLRSSAPESTAYNRNIHQIEGAQGAFSSDEDNQRFADTLNEIKQQHAQIEQMFQNVLARLSAVATNYREADRSATIH